jgi:hypothetical protein
MIIVKNKFPLPRKDDLLDSLSELRYFIKINLKSGYHKIIIQEGDGWDKTFKTKNELHEWLFMPIVLINTPSIFTRMIIEMLRHFLGKFVVMYFDDTLIYNGSRGEHFQHIRVALEVLNKEKLCISLNMFKSLIILFKKEDTYRALKQSM